jgi:hypothetical protein
MGLEKDVEKMLIDACDAKFHLITVKSECVSKGFVDRIVFDLEKKRIHFVEIKNKTRYKRTALQKEWAKVIQLSGGEYHLIDGVDEMREFIRGVLNG